MRGDRIRSVVPWLFAGWTLFVWGGRLRNVVVDPEGVASVGWLTLTGAIAFSALGLVLLAALMLRWRGRFARMVPVVLVPLSYLTVVTWVVRGIDIAVGDHTVGFIVVHLVLAVVSLALAALSLFVVGGIRLRR